MGTGATTLNIAGRAGYGIFTAASDVTIRDLTVTGSATLYSLKIQGVEPNDPQRSGNGIPATNILLKNLVVLNPSARDST